MRFLVPAVAAVLAISAVAIVFADTPSAPAFTPYPAPDFVINMPDGKALHLSSLKGKVVMVECLYTTCPHCAHASQVFTQLYKEYGSRGFQPVGAAFNEEVFNSVPANVVNEFISTNKANYPIGWSDRAKVLEFLGISQFDRFVVPQIVWIDRKGMVRAKTLPSGEDVSHYQEPYYREMIETLTKEPAAAAAKKPAAHRTVHTAQN